MGSPFSYGFGAGDFNVLGLIKSLLKRIIAPQYCVEKAYSSLISKWHEGQSGRRPSDGTREICCETVLEGTFGIPNSDVNQQLSIVRKQRWFRSVFCEKKGSQELRVVMTVVETCWSFHRLDADLESHVDLFHLSAFHSLRIYL